METLSKLFGNGAKVKIIKLFVFNPGIVFDLEKISSRTKELPREVKKIIPVLQNINLVKRKKVLKTIEIKRGRKKIQKKAKVTGWTLNEQFPHLVALQVFLVTMNHLGPKEISKKLQRAGHVKLAIIAGVFTQDPESRVDLLVVGDSLKKPTILSIIKSIEADMGKEIRYAVFETPDFQYRLGLYDKLVRDILDFPHQKIINKLGIA